MWSVIIGILLVSFTLSILLSIEVSDFISHEKASLEEWFCPPACIPLLFITYFIPYLKWITFMFVMLIIIVALSKRESGCSLDRPYLYTFKPVDIWAVLVNKLYTYIKHSV